MGAVGAIIMAFFGSVFAAMTLALPLALRGPVLFAPFVVAAAIIAGAVIILRRPGPRSSLTPIQGRVIMWSSIAEGVGIFLAINVVVNLGHPEWQLPAIALIVGLHFIPIARATRLPAFRALAIALIVAAFAGILLLPPTGPVVAGSVAALALWWAAILAVRRDARAQRA